MSDTWTNPDNHTWSVSEVLTAANMNTYIRQNLGAAFPPGKIEFFIGSYSATTETLLNGGWLLCNGAAVSRTTYSALNTLLSGLSYPFGSGDGSTTFNVPDLLGRALWALGSNSDVSALGASDGLTEANRSPKHNTTNGLTMPVVTDGSVGVSSGAGHPSDSDHTAANTFTAFGGTLGPGGSRPTDAPAFLVCGGWFVKT